MKCLWVRPERADLGLTHNFHTRLERLARHKHSSLFGQFISYEGKRFFEYSPLCQRRKLTLICQKKTGEEKCIILMPNGSVVGPLFHNPKVKGFESHRWHTGEVKDEKCFMRKI